MIDTSDTKLTSNSVCLQQTSRDKLNIKVDEIGKDMRM